MQENNFEKHVQQKLDGLHLTPSEPVWGKIEAAIKKKRERKLVFWMLPLLLLTGGMVWWLITPRSKTTGAQQAQEQINQKQTFSKPHTGEAEEKQERETAASQQQTQSDEKPANTAGKAEVQKAANERHTNRAHTIFTDKAASKNIGLKATDENNKTTDAAKNKIVSENTTKHTGIIVRKVTFIDIQRSSTLTGNKAPVVPDTKNKIVIDVTDRLKNSGPVVQAKKKATWQWYITGRAGASNVSEKLFSLSMEKSSRAEALFDNVTQSGNFSRSTAVQRSSSSTKGAQFSIGAGLKRALRKRIFFVTGLQYSFYRNHLTVAPYLPADSVASALYNFYSAQSAYSNTRIVNRFTNTFHFVELPVGLEHQLLKQHPLHVQYGVAISQLLSGKAVRHNSNTNLYSQNASALRKTGFSFYTTVNYTVWKSPGFTLQAGPQVQYGLYNLFKNGAAKNHLVSGGLAATMAF